MRVLTSVIFFSDALSPLLAEAKISVFAIKPLSVVHNLTHLLRHSLDTPSINAYLGLLSICVWKIKKDYAPFARAKHEWMPANPEREIDMTGMTRRELGISVVATSLLAGSYTSAGAAAAETVAGSDPLWFVDPDLRPGIRAMLIEYKGFPALSEKILSSIRAAFPVKPPLSTVSVEKRTVPNPGAPDVTIYVINAKPGARRGGILHTHGGGFVIGSAASDLSDLQTIAAELDCCIVTVEYRLAPETRYTGSIADNYAGLLWLHSHASELGIDPARIAVMGESAGAGHAALLAIRARDRGKIAIAFQCLVQPMLDDRTGSTRKVPEPIGTILWTAEANRFGWRSFLGQEPGGPNVPAAAVPARVASTAKLPPTWIGIGSVDLFVQESMSYASRLIDALVPTELMIVPGGYHGFNGIGAGTPVGKRFNEARIAALRRGLAPRAA
jgi:acetyl esterase/lipase